MGDFFSVNRSDFTLGSCQALDRWAAMMGIMMDQDKAISQAVDMLLLGVVLAIDNIGKCITSRLNEANAKKWSKQLCHSSLVMNYA